jgi:hypothetical protein
MKAFIVAALLVACVAGQSMDLMDLVKFQRPNHRRSSLSTVEDLLLKEKLGRRNVMDINNRDSIYDVEDIMSPTSVFGGRVGGVLSLEELVSQPLFREYLQIPLFRQFYEEHPIVFRRYVESALFQKFWTVPQFQMYFRNPVFFYKYIVPQVKLITELVVPSTTEGIYDYESTPSTRFNPYSMYPRVNREWSVPMSSVNRMGQFENIPTTTNTHYYKYLLEKMMNHMNLNKMGENRRDMFETLTDVKMLPTGEIKEQTFGKIVDPITRRERITVGDVKLVDEKIVPVEGMDFPRTTTTFGGIEGMNKIFGHHNTQSIKDILLKHIILNKIFGDKKQVITPSVYKTLFGDNKEMLIPEMYNMMFNHHKNVLTPEIMENILGENKHVFTPEVFDTLFDTKKTFTPEIFDTVFGEDKKQILTPELVEILFKGNKHVLTPRVLEAIFGKKVYTPEVYGNLFGGEDVQDIFTRKPLDLEEDVYNKFNVNYEPVTFNKVNRFAVNPLISRMLKNTKNTMKTEKMVEELQREKMMEKLIKNKEYSTLLKNVDTEIPTMTQGRFHIPLSYGKPLVGSGIEEFGTENKDIKF